MYLSIALIEKPRRNSISWILAARMPVFKNMCQYNHALFASSLHHALSFISFIYIIFVNSKAGKKFITFKRFCVCRQIMGSWYVVMYYASSEEELTYKCMRAVFSMSPTNMEVMMNFTYSFTYDPDHEQLLGNITWVVPNAQQPAHWVHTEDSCEYSRCCY